MAACLVAWLPLFFLTLLEGVAFQGVQVPFIFDIDLHVRLLISIPLLIYGEALANNRLNLIVKKFTQNNLVTIKDHEKFNSYIRYAMERTNSLSVELFLLVFVVLVGYSISKQYQPFDVSIWYLTANNGTSQLTWAGFWYAFISLPIFQFLLLRWYYRLGIWYQFLWRVSRLKLCLNSLHPDRAGGLSFLVYSLYALEFFLLAHSVLLSGMIFNRMWNTHAQLAQFQYEIVSLIILLIIIPIIPLTFFIIILSKTKRAGTLEYTSFAQGYVDKFREKWLNTNSNTELLGTSDIQSLADLSNSFEIPSKMRITPYNWNNVLQLAIFTALPLFPLVLMTMPVEKIITKLISIIF